MKKYYYILLFCFLFACGKQDKHLVTQVISSFEDTISVKGYKTDISDQELIYDVSIFDTIIVFQLFYTLPNYYRAYSLNTFKKLGDFLVKGRGPNEVGNAQFISKNTSIIKNGDIHLWFVNFPSKIALLNLSKTLCTGKTIIDKEYDFIRLEKRNILYESNGTYILDDGIFLINRDTERSKNRDNPNPEQMHVIYDYYKDRIIDTLRYKYKLQDWSVMDKSNSKIISTSYSEDLISIYDIHSKKEQVLFHTIKMPKELAGFRNPKVKKPYFTYCRCDLKKDLIFALYNKSKNEPV